MTSLRNVLRAICALVLLLPVAAPAQMRPELIRLAQPRDNWLGPDYWTDPIPATYTIEIAGTGLCLERTRPENLLQVPFLRVQTCNPANFDQNFELSPAAVDTPLWPATTNVRWRVNSRGHCAGTARGVAFGAPRIDFNPCDLRPENGNRPEFRGALDQYVVMVRARQGQYAFRQVDGRCWSVGGAVQAGSQLEVQPCDGRAGQQFQLTLQIGVAEPTNHTAAEAFGWINIGQVNDIENGVGAPDRFRRLSGLDLGGSDIRAGFWTENDRGISCARQCARESQCRAFTWVQIGAQDPDHAICWLKNGMPAPTPNPDTVSGILRP